MSAPLLATKLYAPPPSPNAIVRARLVAQLNAGLHRKLTLVSAPAGFGKTTLVSAWLAVCGRPAAWLSLEAADSDPNRFLAYLVAALQAIAPDIGKAVLLALQSPQPPALESLLTILLNELAAIPEPAILVLDDYHVLAAKAVDAAVAFLLEHLPPQLHLVITTREDPSLPLPRLRARGQLTELRAADLRFTPAEAAEFLNERMGLSLSAADISVLETRTEGWIAGLQLAALSLQGQTDVSHFIQSFTGSHRFVLDYLVAEVLQQQPADVQAFLLRTSILDRMCAPLCDAILRDDPSATPAEGLGVGRTAFILHPSSFILDYLEHANLFIVPLDNERRWYRYHHLFGNLLRQRLGLRVPPAAIAQDHLRASAWYAQNGDAAEAFAHAIAAGDVSRAADLAETAWQGMNASSQSASWLGWVKALPEELIRTRPVLSTQIAWALMESSEVAASESRLRDAERCLQGPSAEIVSVVAEQFRILPARIAFVRAFNALTQRDFSSGVKYVELVYKLTPAENHFLHAQATAILGSIYWANGDLDAACRSMSEWIESAQKAGNFIFAVVGASGKADILTAQGRLREAISTYQQAVQLASAHAGDAQQITAPHHLGLAMLYHEMGDDEAAARHTQKSLELGAKSTQKDWPYRRCLALARLKEFDGDLDAALGLLAEAKRFYVRSLIPYTRPIDAIEARIYLKQGRLSKAREWASEQSLTVDDTLSYLREFEHITLARVLLAEYQAHHSDRSVLDAIRLLDCLLQVAEIGDRPGSIIEILILQALAHAARGDRALALAPLERALALAEPEGYVRIFAGEGKPLAQLLTRMKDEGGRMNEYVHKLLTAFAPKVAVHPSSLILHPLIEPLSPRELEILRLMAQGLSNREIGERLFLALNTVKGHNQKIFAKLQVQRRTEAVARALALRLL